MAFLIKRGDSKPNIPVQVFEPDGVTPLDLTSAIEINIVVSLKEAAFGDPPTFKKPVTITDPLLGKFQYDWEPPDTYFAGEYRYEFEIEWGDTELQTLPVDGYFELTIIDDLG